jgi:Rrf2 family iron-sulfur cluster assembly transcriptional regulator
MNLTTKGRYAVMAMVDLAMNSSSEPVVLADIATRQDIAISYLEQIFMHLRKAGLVNSVRGPGGGYILTVKPEEMRISDIVIAVESIKMTRCGSEKKEGCMQSQNKAKCMTHDLWDGLANKIHEYLRSVTLADICNQTLVVGRAPLARGIEANV